MSYAGSWTKLDEEWDARYRSFILVRGDSSLDLTEYKVCVDDRVHGTPIKLAHMAPANGIYTRVEPGVHRVQLRQLKPRAAERLVSNTVEFDMVINQQVRIRATMCDGQPVLQFDEELPNQSMQPPQASGLRG